MKRFGRCRLDVSTRQLFRDEMEVHLSPKAYDLLTLLLENRPAVMSKGDLHERIWRDTFVSDASLARLVTEIRHAIGDEQSRSGIIRTVHKFGYAFAADVEEDEQRPGAARPDPTSGVASWLIVGLRTIPLGDGDNLIGRDPLVAIHLDWPSVSRHHARIRITGGHATIEDLQSRNGTYVRGARITAAQPLADGDEIKVASVEMVFRQLPMARTITDMA